jgi:hypothetical protein
MADATAGRDAKRSVGDLQSVPIAASTVIYGGTIVTTNASGYAQVGGDDASTTFVGIAADTVDNSSGSAGDKSVTVYTEGSFELAFTGTATQASVGITAMASDSQTVAAAATTTNDVPVGRVVEFIDASTVRVKISQDAS